MAATAQNESDAILFSLNRPTGTARSISLGGAMGALGGDFTSISINPAGLAVYRSSEFSFTPSITYRKTKANYGSTVSDDDKFSVPFQQISFVGTYKPMREGNTGLISTHFSIGYTRTNDFARNTFIQGRDIQSSLLDEFKYSANGFTSGNLDDFYTRMAWDVYLLDLRPDSNNEYFHGFEYIDANNTPQWGPRYGINQGKVINEKGNSGEFSIAGGVNISNKLFLGGSLGITTLYYDMKSQHFEEVADGLYKDEYLNYRNTDASRVNNFTFTDNFSSSGVGVNLKVGVIYKPINALRIGAAVHTPNFYSIDLDYETDVKSSFFDGTTELAPTIPTGEFSYNFRTPMKLIGSLAYIIGTKGLLSVDYERTDYSAMKYKSKINNPEEMDEMKARNETISTTFKPTNNLRFGGEFRATEALSLRAGYALYQTPYKKTMINSNGTHHSYSGGLGLKMSNMYLDFAYILRQEKEKRSIYYPSLTYDSQPLAEINTDTHQFAVTVGWRF
jgi:hypothetical protein